MRSAVFLDRDGVINANRADYVKSWDEWVFLPGVFEAMSRLARTDRAIVVVSNQAAIGRGLVRREVVDELHRRMRAAIERHGGRIDAILYCPHRPEDGCACRKPRPGMLLQAARELQLDLSRSCLIGDAASDVEAALEAGVAPVLVLTGRGVEQRRVLAERGYGAVPTARDLAEAVDALVCEKEELQSPMS